MSFSPCPDPTLGDKQTCEAIDLVVVPRAVDLGEMTVRRALPSLERQLVGPFIFFDQMGPAEFLTNQGIDVRPHPHINLATLTYLLDGEIVHKDSLGSDLAIRPGEVNLMSAGKGIVHSERTSEHHKQTGQRLFGLQTWMALPESLEEGDPNFVHLDAPALPKVTVEGINATVIAGNALGECSPLQTASATLYVDVQLEKGATMPVPVDYIERAIYLLQGTITIDGQSFNEGQLVILKTAIETVIKADTDARFMVFGGEPMDGPRYIWWNFVSSRLERIELAKQEWSNSRFDTVPGDEIEFIPLPTDNTKPRLAKGSQHN